MNLIQYLNYKLERIIVFKDSINAADTLEYIRDGVSALMRKCDGLQQQNDALLAEVDSLRSENQDLKNQVATLNGAQHERREFEDTFEQLKQENELLKSHLMSEGYITTPLSRRHVV